MKIAICSPESNAYSETFIRAHRDLLSGQISFYHSGLLPSFLDELPISVQNNPIKTKIRLIINLTRFKCFSLEEYAFYDSLKTTKPDVILAEYGPTAVAILPMVKKLEIPMVVHFHGYDASRFETVNKYKESYQQVFAYASSIISVSESMSDNLIKAGCPLDKIRRTICGPDERFLNLEPAFTQPVFLAVGRFVEKKAHHLTILAFYKTLQVFPDAKLRIVGDGPLKPVCEDIVKFFGIENQVSFLGVLKPEEIMREMTNAMAFVQHSKTASDGDMEGTPVAILEAQAAALPVISTYHAGIQEVVIPEVTGFLVQENDVNKMAEYMIKILHSKEMAKTLGMNGRNNIYANFRMSKHIQTLQSTLEKVLK